MQHEQVEAIAHRIWLDFAEMPGLGVTFWQAQRLWNLSDDVCDRALNALIRAGYLVQTPDGRYRRSHRGWTVAEAPARDEAWPAEAPSC